MQPAHRDGATSMQCLDGLKMQEGQVVLFELRKDVPWEAKLFMREVQHAGKLIHVVGC